MNEIREAAVAYYLNMPENVHENACSLFQSMDTDGDGKISYSEFRRAYKKLDVAGQHLDQKLFVELDENGDGSLDFEEFLSLFYVVKSGRLMYCEGCQNFLKGLYFSCLPCFDQGITIVNYCIACYRVGHHRNHHHNYVVTFVDNYALVLSKAGSRSGAAQPGASRGENPTKPQSGASQGQKPTKAQKMKDHFDYFVGGIAIGQAFAPIVTNFCSIM